MSSRRNGSASGGTRAAELAAKSRLHMDRNPQHARITDPSLPAGRRKEIDNVMKRARAASPGSWDRRLLEVEEKDPNRWRHTGYKQMYLDGSISPSPPRGRSRSPPARRSRSPLPRRASPARVVASPRGRHSPPARRASPARGPPRGRSRSPVARGRSPVARGGRSPVVRGRSPVARGRSPVARGRRTPPPLMPSGGRPRTPPPAVGTSRGERREPVAVMVSRRESPGPGPGRAAGSRAAPARAPPGRPPAPPSRPVRPPSPPPQRKGQCPPQRSPSGSSMSSCSDESCSVCSAKNKRRPKSRSPSPPAARPAKRPPPPPRPLPGKPPPGKPLNSGNPVAQPSSLALRPTRELLKARDAVKRSREEKVLEWQRSQMAVQQPRRIKREGERAGERERRSASPARAVSPAAIAAALADEEDDESTASSEPPPQRLTLSERFGKMAQWSADRSATLENMRITRREAGLHVLIERAEAAAGAGGPEEAGGGESPPERYAHEPAPVGSYPEELLASAPGGVPSWDDVRVRFDYYKKRGYLRGLTLSDYVKWEEWWYKYQEWLKRERAYERWAGGGGGGGGEERREQGGRRRRGRRARRGS